MDQILSTKRPSARRQHGSHLIKGGQHVTNLEELFAIIAGYNLKFNPIKCVFGVQAGKFLGFLLTERGIEANPNKCAAIIEMRSPTNVKEVQRVIGSMTALSRFLSANDDKRYLFFQFLKKNDRFVCTDECKKAFAKLKEYLANPPVLGKPTLGIPIRLYFLMTDWAISSIIFEGAGEDVEANLLHK